MYCASPHPLLTKTIANKRQIIVRTFIAAISQSIRPQNT